MKLIEDSTTKFKYVLESEFNNEILNFCRKIKSMVGSKNFYFYQGKWRFNNVFIVDYFKREFPNIEIEDKLWQEWLKERNRINNILKVKNKKETDIEINNIKGELYPFQKLGFEFLCASNGRALILDQMGVGKTLQSLTYIAHQEFKKTLVVCPASIKYSWQGEVSKWTDLKSLIIQSGIDTSADDINKHDIIIINYDILKKYFDILNSIKWDCLICDESSYLKNPSTIRSKAVKELSLVIPHIILLSGTPILNRVVELFPGLSILERDIWNDWWNFTKRYCSGHRDFWGWRADGASNTEELKERINHLFIRRNKEDVLKDLPSKTFVDIPIELTAEDKQLYNLAEKNFLDYLLDIKNKSEEDANKTMSAVALAKLNELRQVSNQSKINPAIELAENIIDSGEKVLIFCSFNKPLELLKEHFKDRAVMIIGKTPEEERKEAIYNFQGNSKIKVFLGGIKSSGMGITLTEASAVIFIDEPWTPADHEQAEDRAHRIGNKAENITIYQIYARNTVDEYMKNVLVKKKKVFSNLFGEGKEYKKTTINIFNDVLKIYKEKL